MSSQLIQIMLAGEDGKELTVANLSDAVTFTIPLLPAYGGAPSLQASDGDAAGEAGGSAETALRGTYNRSVCVFWDDVAEAYSTAGCVTLPNPAPPTAGLYWRSHVAALPHGLQEAWGMDNASTAATGCVEEWEAVYEEYMGIDAGLRKYIGEGCRLQDPENSAGCWWDWTIQRFLGAGCRWAAEASCLCTHLTDFKAAPQTKVLLLFSLLSTSLVGGS
ncbi:hypothetical protein CYMTET_5124 [Cymbomonas tetramitiformis]|uniref:Uncharacterized protein n=1 Tax=Cymbomonas tetramitiformis TaxID=36881 RepID=A0AAE0GZS7_9CHLO|nr:hypothetical protein CYMTET_5124 [Cymbomonas tetramitiformis]